MTDSAPPPTYWLQLNEGPPQGPFPMAEIIGKSQSFAIAEAKICPVGATTWARLSDHPEFAPLPTPASPASLPEPQSTPMAEVPKAETTSGEPLPATPSVAKPAAKTPEWVASAVGFAVLAIVGYLIYDYMRPLKPREVAERFVEAKTGDEAKKYAIPSLYPVIDLVFQLDDHASDNDFVLTDEGSGSKYEYFIGFRGTTFETSVARRVPITGFITLQQSDGWKAADISYSTYDGQPFPEPVSLVKNKHMLLEEQRKAAQSRPLTAKSSSSPSGTDSKQRTLWIGGIYALFKTGAAKTIGLILVAVIGGIFAWIKSIKRPV